MKQKMISKFENRGLTPLAPAVVIIAGIAVGSVVFGVNMSFFTRDVTAIAGIHPFSGVLSNLGILLWCAAAAVCFFAAAVLRRRDNGQKFLFLICSGFLSAYLLLDDLFLFHEDLALRYLGIKAEFIYVVLGIAVLAYLFAFRKVITRTNSGLLFAAAGFLGGSVFTDVFLDRILQFFFGEWVYFIEDGLKWLGINAWLAYYAGTAFRFLEDTQGEGIDPSLRSG